MGMLNSPATLLLLHSLQLFSNFTSIQFDFSWQSIIQEVVSKISQLDFHASETDHPQEIFNVVRALPFAAIVCCKLFNATEWHLLLQLICNNILAFPSLLVKKKIYPGAKFIFADAGAARETVRLNRRERLREAVQDPAKIRIRACIQPRALAEGDSVQRAEARIGPIAMNKPHVLVGRAEAAGADVVVIAAVPDNVSAVAASLIVNATGAVKLKTTVLFTPGEMDAATKKTAAYRPPGQ